MFKRSANKNDELIKTVFRYLVSATLVTGRREERYI